jgi:putative DNA primase/helicase
MENQKKPFHETVAEKLIEQLKEGTAPWQKPWQPGEAGAFMPTNPTTGKRYKGINAIQLMSQGHSDQRWMTYKQAVAVDAQVRKGEKGTPIQYWKFSEEQAKTDAVGKPVLDAQGEPVTQTVKLERPRVFFATVFNAEQIDGLPPPQARKEQEWSAVERAETILQASGAVIRHGEQNRAFYRPATDSIHLPDKSQFPAADSYYATALHELGHWTGHESRLARDLVHPFGSEGYAKEELRAEIASMILGDELGIGHSPEQHAAYVGSWIKALQDDPLEIFRAAADAEKIQDYVLGLEQQQVQQQVPQLGEGQAQSQQPDHPEAFFDTNGMLRNWNTADSMPPEWRGIAKRNDTLFFVGSEGGERSFTALQSKTLPEARQEVATMKPQGNVQKTGDEMLTNNADEVIALEHIQNGTLPRALDGANLAELGRVDDVLARMFPLNTQNEFWQRNELPWDVDSLEQKIDAAEDLVAQRWADANVAAARVSLVAGETTIDAGEEFNRRAEIALGFTLPHDWNGRVQVQGNIYDGDDGGPLGDRTIVSAASVGAEPQFWGVYAQKENGEHQWLADFETQQQAEELGERLALIDAHSEINEHEQATKLARINEERVRRDPNSTDEDISAAKDARKNAEFAAMQNDADLQRRIAEFEREQKQEPTPATVPAAHLMTSDEFAQVATATPLENHGRRWEVFAGEQSFGFSDADSAAGAVKDAHKREVNNALYSRSTENAGVVPIQAMPPERVLREYPDLQEQFAGTVNFKQQESQAEKAALPEKTFINVPFKQKDEAKTLGAKWDRQEQSWYVPTGVDPAPFAKWAQGAATAAVDAPPQPPATQGRAEQQKPAQERQYLAVPYGERVAAKAAGAEWDKTAKSWYAGQKADMAKLERWKPENVPGQQGPAMMPQEEFAEALRSVGCVVSGEHPIMDGKKHRVSVEGEKHSEKAGSGFYVGHLDGHPAGYIKNNKTGVDMKWKSKGYALDPEQKAQMQAEAAAKLQAREAEQVKLHEKTALRVGKQMADLVPVGQPTPYMQAKGVEPQPGVLTDKDGQKTYIPAVDATGKQWTMQYIQEDGTKRFAKDSHKEGCFHVVGGMEALTKAPALVIGEGYATASSLSQSLGYATVAAFDSGNLPHVAKALHAKFPDKPIIIAGDDDKHLEATQGVNPGRSKAEEAAKAVGGAKLFPIFAPGENSYPAELDPVTPEKFREHQRTGSALSDAQLAALDQMKGKTDFNDLANKSVLGKEGIQRQVNSFVDSVIEKHQARVGLQQEQLQKQERQPRRAAKVG